MNQHRTKDPDAPGFAPGVARTVYAVTRGEYSDYRVAAVFDREEDAEAATAAGYGDDVVPMDLFPAGVLPVRADYWVARVTVQADGAISGEPWVTAQTGWNAAPPSRRRPKVTQVDNRHLQLITVEAQSEAQAVKVCRDRAAKLRAEILEPIIAGETAKAAEHPELLDGLQVDTPLGRAAKQRAEILRGLIEAASHP